MAELTIEHRLLIEEENIQVADLPTDIRSKIRGYNLNLNNHYKNPSLKSEKTLKINDVEIADLIQTWIESTKTPDAEELDSNDDNSEKFEPKEPVVIAEEPIEEPAPTEPIAPVVPAEPEMDATEKALREKWSNGTISVGEFRLLLGREPNYPNQKVGNIVMRKQYQLDSYKMLS